MPASDGKGWVPEVAIPWTALRLQPTAGATLRFDIAVIDGDGRRAVALEFGRMGRITRLVAALRGGEACGDAFAHVLY